MKTTPFQTILIGTFIIIFIIAIIAFSRSASGGNSSNTARGTVRIWGTFPEEIVRQRIDTSINNTQSDYRVEYQEIGRETFTLSFIRALADRNPPDLLFVDNEIYAQVRDKLYTIPYEALTLREYQSTYIDGASLFLESNGVSALPVAVDPLVLYYNRDLLAGQNYLIPPNTWTGLVQSIPRFLRRDVNQSIAQNAIALGEVTNIPHYKKILSTIFLQSGVPITQKTPEGQFFPALGTQSLIQDGIPPGVEVLDFYTSFANTTNAHFNWSRSLPSADEFFLSGSSAFYIAPASELFSLQERNPNLNFDMAPLFQIDDAVRPATFGTLYGIAVVAESPNFVTAYTVMSQLSTDAFTTELTNALAIAPVRRSLLLQAQTDRYRAIMYQVAPNTFSWIDPNPEITDRAFTQAVAGILRGSLSVSAALGELQGSLTRIGQ